MSKLYWRVLIYGVSFALAAVLAMFATSCATECDEACDGELERELCDACAEGPVLEKTCVETYCD